MVITTVCGACIPLQFISKVLYLNCLFVKSYAFHITSSYHITLASGPLQATTTIPFSSSSDGYFSMISTLCASDGTGDCHGRL